jgi:hypothetical protein
MKGYAVPFSPTATKEPGSPLSQAMFAETMAFRAGANREDEASACVVLGAGRAALCCGIAVGDGAKKVVCKVIPTVMTTTERTIARMVFLSISAPDGLIHEKKSQER